MSESITAKYSSGEKILCFHGPLLYEAKCLDVKQDKEEIKYLVHYQGWNKNWDEWVTEKRMAKYDDVNLKRQKELEKMIKSGKKVKTLRKSELKLHSAPSDEVINQLKKLVPEKQENAPLKTSASASTTKAKPDATESTKSVKAAEKSASVNTSVPTGRRRKARVNASSVLDSKEGFLTKAQLNVALPEELKLWLVDDWDLITRQSRLYDLPAAKSIASILNEYLDHIGGSSVSTKCKEEPHSYKQKEASPSQMSSINLPLDLHREFVAGLQHYFNSMLGAQLLYKFERLQYSDLLKQHPDKRMTELYGPIHLLRMFVKFREMVSYTKVDLGSLGKLELLLEDLFRFLENNLHVYYRIEYYTASTAEYQRRSMC